MDDDEATWCMTQTPCKFGFVIDSSLGFRHSRFMSIPFRRTPAQGSGCSLSVGFLLRRRLRLLKALILW
jgi:hypothetical protein